MMTNDDERGGGRQCPNFDDVICERRLIERGRGDAIQNTKDYSKFQNWDCFLFLVFFSVFLCRIILCNFGCFILIVQQYYIICRKTQSVPPPEKTQGWISLSFLCNCFVFGFYRSNLAFVSFLTRYQTSLSYSATLRYTDGFLCGIVTRSRKENQL